MGLLEKLRKKKQANPEQTNELQTAPKTALRLYLENLIGTLESFETGALKVPGIPFDINPKKFLPMIAKQVSDEMLEKLADFILIVAADIRKIRHSEQSVNILESEIIESENEIIANSTELQEK